MLTTTDVFNLLITEIQTHFPGVSLGYEDKEFSDRSELWVHVLDLNQFQAVDEFCKILNSRRVEPSIPVSVFAKTWTGPWPGGLSVQELKNRRDEFRKRLQLQS